MTLCHPQIILPSPGSEAFQGLCRSSSSRLLGFPFPHAVPKPRRAADGTRGPPLPCLSVCSSAPVMPCPPPLGPQIPPAPPSPASGRHLQEAFLWTPQPFISPPLSYELPRASGESWWLYLCQVGGPRGPVALAYSASLMGPTGRALVGFCITFQFTQYVSSQTPSAAPMRWQGRECANSPFYSWGH